jgi:hypothetical protein
MVYFIDRLDKFRKEKTVVNIIFRSGNAGAVGIILEVEDDNILFQQGTKTPADKVVIPIDYIGYIVVEKPNEKSK